MLVVFPLAFFTGAFVVDLVGQFGEKYALHAFSFYLCIGGAGMAVLAAVPGTIDYLKIVPPRSSAKKRATLHGIMNTVVLLLFCVVILLRQNGFDAYLLFIEFVAVVMLVIASWHGGTLVHRNQIGIDHRYASAGKWKEAWFVNAKAPLEIADTTELKKNQMMLLHIDGQRIVLANTGDGYAAFDDRCPHRGGSLAAGVMMCGQVQCPWHGSQYDVRSGGCLQGPATSGIHVYQVKEQDGKVLLLNFK